MKHFIGIDIGDKVNTICVLNNAGKIIEETSIANNEKSLKELIQKYSEITIAIEACSHSLWMNQLLVSLGCKVYIANPRKVALISRSLVKNDRVDASILARLVRSDPSILYPVKARDISTQEDIMILKTRRQLVQARGDLIRHIRGIIKPFGVKLPKEVTVDNFHVTVIDYLPPLQLKLLKPTISSIKSLHQQIKKVDKQIKRLIDKKYPEALNLQTIPGVGAITALMFILIIGDPFRFTKSRDVGTYFGLTPKRDQSGEMDKSLSITKSGDHYMRVLLVNCSHQILGVFGKDTQLRRHGLKLAGNEGNKIRKKKAIVAVSRKLVVLMHSMLVSKKEFVNTIKA